MPQVSIIVPCYNEEKTIELLLSAIYRQTWPKEAMEVVIVDGLSSDGTRQAITRFQQTHPDLTIRLIDNARRIIPAALNCAITAAHGEYIIRLDGHCEPEADYVAHCLADLQSGAGEMVGGVWQILPSGSGWLARSIAAAAAHPFGVGDALYRYTTRPALVDTVPFGAFRRSLADRIGFYDETLLANEDYEFNTRIRQSGGRVWLNPAIRSTYYARPDLQALARQYWRYGYWKFQMLRRYPETLRWRQALPPLFVLSLAFWLILALFWNGGLWMGLAEIGLYGLVLTLGSIPPARRQKDLRLLVGIPLAIATMHCAWGAGLIGSMVKSVLGRGPIQAGNQRRP